MLENNIAKKFLIFTFQENVTNAAKIRWQRGTKAQELKKCQQAICSLEQMISAIEHALITVSEPIKQVLIIIGATVVSPKEYYLIRIPTCCYDGNLLDFRQCMATLFRKLVSSDITGEFKNLKPSKVFVMLYASSQSAKVLHKFKPRINYKLPRRGKRILIDFIFNSARINHNLSHHGDNNFDISGIVPLESCDLDLSSGGLPAVSERKALSGVPYVTEAGHLPQELDLKMQESSEQNEWPNYVWFQCKYDMKGYKDKMSKKSSVQDLLL